MVEQTCSNRTFCNLLAEAQKCQRALWSRGLKVHAVTSFAGLVLKTSWIREKCNSNNQSVSTCTGHSSRSHHDSFSTNRTLMHDVNSVNNQHSNLKHVSCHGELNITFRLKHFNSVAGRFRGIDQTEDQRTFGICASELSIVMFF